MDGPDPHRDRSGASWGRATLPQGTHRASVLTGEKTAASEWPGKARRVQLLTALALAARGFLESTKRAAGKINRAQGSSARFAHLKRARLAGEFLESIKRGQSGPVRAREGEALASPRAL